MDNQEVEMRIGLEKEIISPLVLRGYICPFRFSYHRKQHEEKNYFPFNNTNSDSTEFIYDGPIYSYSFGIGYRPIENIMIDINFNSINFKYSTRDYSGNDIDADRFNNNNSNTKKRSFVLNFVVEYKFQHL